MCDPDSIGRPELSMVEGSHFTIDAYVFIAAIGQGQNPILISELPELKRGKRGNVIVDDEFRNSMRKVYAWGILQPVRQR